jgi:hypothetical protein
MCAPLDRGNGEEAEVKSALKRAADLLGRARFPVFGGLFKTAMFAAADLMFKSGKLVVRDGKVVRVTWGCCYHVEPGFDAQIKRRVNAFYDRYYGADPSSFGMTEAITRRPDRFATVPCLN